MKLDYPNPSQSGEVSTRLIVVLAVVGVLVIAAVPLGFHIWPAIKKAFEEPGPQVGVVRTAAALKAMKPFKLPDSCEVRIGISSETSYVGGAIMVYCLAENASLFDNDSALSRSRWRKFLGPIFCKVKKQNDKNYLFDSSSETIYPPSVADGDFFYITVETPEKADYSIEFYDAKEQLIVTKVISAREQQPYPWLSVSSEEITNSRYGYKISLNDRSFLPIITHRKRGEPLPEKLPRLPFEKEIPATGDFNLVCANKSFILTSSTSFMCLPEEHIAVRFEVNDKPVTPELPYKKTSHHKNYYHNASTRMLVIVPDFNYSELGAVRGDRIKIQFMYTYDSNASFCGAGSRRGYGPDSEDIMISNFVEFKCK